MNTHERKRVEDLNVMVAGQGGDGSLTVISLISRLLAQRGFHLYSSRNVASRIKGGHAAAMLRGSLTRRGCIGDQIDLLVAFDFEAIEVAGGDVAPNGIVIFDSSQGEPPQDALPNGPWLIGIPFGRLAVRELRRDLFKNSLAFGIVSLVLGIDRAEAVECLEQVFTRLTAEQLKANIAAFEDGLKFAADNDLLEDGTLWSLDSATRRRQLLMTGNDAIGLGFVAAGGRFFTGYPITPATEILEWLNVHISSYGGVSIQAEDELSAINMAIGGALTGVRSMTATSGPGIALMQEGIAHSGSAEIPLVIVDCQRAGPSTGMPTKPEQSDINMLVYGGNGDFPRIVLSPGGPRDCFNLTVDAVNLAEQLQCPVFIASDQAIAQDSRTVDLFEIDQVQVDRGKRLEPEDVAKLSEYRRYTVTDDGVSDWAVPGSPGGMNLVTGNERSEWGLVSNSAGNRKAMVDKRYRKIMQARHTFPEGRRWGDQNAKIGILGIGFVHGPMEEATERLSEQGVAVAGLQPRTLWPVPDETLDFIAACQHVYVVEQNASGQLAALLMSAGAPKDKLRNLLKYDGRPIRAGEIEAFILADLQSSGAFATGRRPVQNDYHI